MNNQKGQFGLDSVLVGFVLIATTLILLVLLIYIFGSVHIGLEDTAISNSVVNESNAWANDTDYSTAGVSATGEPRTFTLISVLGDYNQSNGTQSAITNTPVGYNVSIPLTNVSLSSSGVLTNATSWEYPNLSISYTFYNNSASQTASRTAQTNTSGALPLVGILFIILAVGALITILIVSLMGRRRS